MALSWLAVRLMCWQPTSWASSSLDLHMQPRMGPESRSDAGAWEVSGEVGGRSIMKDSRA